MGAGFSKNFGGYLASEVPKFLFNSSEIQSKQKIWKLVQANFDFEDIYYQVMTDTVYDSSDRELINETINNFYLSNEKSMQNSSQINLSKIKRLLSNFIGDKRDRLKGFIFTLNQDLFFEKIMTQNRFSLPGTPAGQIYEKYDRLEAKPIEISIIDNRSFDFENLEYGNLIKLHGSCDWRDSQHKNLMIIGKDKLKTIENLPLLKSYFQLFEKVLYSGNIKLLTLLSGEK